MWNAKEVSTSEYFGEKAFPNLRQMGAKSGRQMKDQLIMG